MITLQENGPECKCYITAPPTQDGAPPVRGVAQTSRGAHWRESRQAPPGKTHSLRPSPQRSLHSKSCAQSAAEVQRPNCPQTAWIPCSVNSHTGAASDRHCELSHETRSRTSNGAIHSMGPSFSTSPHTTPRVWQSMSSSQGRVTRRQNRWSVAISRQVNPCGQSETETHGTRRSAHIPISQAKPATQSLESSQPGVVRRHLPASGLQA